MSGLVKREAAQCGEAQSAMFCFDCGCGFVVGDAGAAQLTIVVGLCVFVFVCEMVLHKWALSSFTNRATTTTTTTATTTTTKLEQTVSGGAQSCGGDCGLWICGFSRLFV